jgi:hypothetical protein
LFIVITTKHPTDNTATRKDEWQRVHTQQQIARRLDDRDLSPVEAHDSYFSTTDLHRIVTEKHVLPNYS